MGNPADWIHLVYLFIKIVCFFVFLLIGPLAIDEATR